MAGKEPRQIHGLGTSSGEGLGAEGLELSAERQPKSSEGDMRHGCAEKTICYTCIVELGPSPPKNIYIYIYVYIYTYIYIYICGMVLGT